MNFIFKFVPPTIAPNIITLTGFISCALSFLLLHLLEIFPKWKHCAFVYCAISVLIYWVCDALDGKQARKTNSGSILGQCFDHTVDSLVMPMIGLMLLKSLKIEEKRTVFLIMLISCYNFIFYSMREKYTNKFFLWYINAPTEGTILCCLIFLLKGLKYRRLEMFIENFNSFLFKRTFMCFSLFEIGYVLIVFQHLFYLVKLFSIIKKSVLFFIYDGTICLYIIFFCLSMSNNSSKWNILTVALLFSTLNLEIMISNANESDTVFPYLDLQNLLFLKNYKHADIISCSVVAMRYVYNIVLRIKEFERCLDIKWNSIKSVY
ncbi:hypothetical protein CDIK_0293 [Cucumispora dikerogammari]|nr:hypothetical protein CDIK_0293 [Cucumispora dikerogammari]